MADRIQPQRLNGPMVARLRKCAADTSSNWDGKITIYPPEARELVALIDANTSVSAQVQFAGTSPSDAAPCFSCDGTGFEVVGDDDERFECSACDGVGGRVIDRG